MGFRINTNIAAMNALSNATQTNLGIDKSLTKLSSGLRINSAADDASGLSIANSLSQQADGLGQAIMNANDGIGVAQTADGALDEYTNIINTVRTKAIQAASDGQDTDSREAIQSDIDRLLEEAQNIAATTSFNGQSLLNGGYENKSFHIGAYAGETVNISIEDSQIANVGKFAMGDGTVTVATGGTGGVTDSLKVTDAAGKSADSGTITFSSGASSVQNAQQIVDAFNASAQTNGADLRASVFEMATSTNDDPKYSIRVDSSDTFTVDTAGTSTVAAGTVGLTNNLSTVDVTTRENAEKAVIITDYALDDIDKTRSDIGSVQNQLESTIRNISVTQVNVQSAESQIRDVDFASESANFSKLSILAQSGSYAMSQANSVQQNVLTLLQ